MAIRAPGYVPAPNLVVDTSGLGRAIDGFGNALADVRRREMRQDVGNALAAGGYKPASDLALRYGDIDTGLKLQNALMAQNQRAAADERRKAQEAESRRRFDLTHGLQKDRLNLERRRKDPREMFKVRATQAQEYGLDPKSPEGRQYVLTGQLSRKAKHGIFGQRNEAAISLGLQPGTEDHKNFVLTGKLAKPQSDLSTNIASGINRLATVPREYGDDQLERATGPLQGGDTYVLSPLARAWGSVSNLLRGGDHSTTEIRSRIAGDVEALSATLKPLIRKPGEGPWTDADQRRLVSVVGDLATARSADEYRRALENVRQRVMANFGIELPAVDFNSGASEAPGQLPPGVTVRRIK